MDMKKGKELSDYLKDHGIKPTIIRIKVLDYLLQSKEHPTAEAIFKEISKQMPTLSITSIYNTLSLFVQKGIIVEINIEPAQVRYDAVVDYHGHFKCIRCGRLLDIPFDEQLEKKPIREINGCKILQKQIYYFGICDRCLIKEKKVEEEKMAIRMGIYKCKICGNVIEVFVEGKGELVCCGQPMALMDEKNKEGVGEKHLPVVEETKNGILVKVGSVEHPMTPEHWIQFIEVITKDGLVLRKDLTYKDKPQAEFNVIKDNIASIREFCNVHGLWVK